MTFSYPTAAPTANEIAQRLGLHRAGRGWRGRCPICKYKQSVVLDVKDGRPVIWCASCNDSAGLAAALRAAAGGVLPAHRPERLPRLDRADPASRIARAEAIWRGASPIEPGSPAGKYWEMRRIANVASSPALRWRSDVPHPSGGRRIALIAAITGADGDFVGIQRIFLKLDGAKADVEPVKASLGPIAGGAVRLQSTSDTLVIGEGIESAAAAGALLELPAWSAISAGNLARSLILPPGIRAIVIAADHDAPGLRAAEEPGLRWRDEGRSVRIIRAARPGTDAADVIGGRRHEPS